MTRASNYPGSRFDIFRQTPDQDFASLPDPFGNDGDGDDNDEQARPQSGEGEGGSGTPQDPHAQKPDEGLGHIEDPDMQSLMQREIAR